MRNLFVQLLRMRFGVPTVLPIGGWRCDCRARGRLVINKMEPWIYFERLEDMQRGDVMHGVSLEDEPFIYFMGSAAGRGRDGSSRGTMRFEICLQTR